MDKVTNISQLQNFILHIRNQRKGYVTNFYIDVDKHKAWIELGALMYQQWDDAVFLFFEHYTSENSISFVNLFYISISEEKVIDHIVECKQYHLSPYIIDIIGRDSMCRSIVDGLIKVGAEHLATLGRMIRIGELAEIQKQANNNVQYATAKDIDIVNDLLRTIFDEQLEQLPLRSELMKMIADQHVLKYVHDDNIAGIILYDLNTTTLYLRYWLTLPEYQGAGVGSTLFKQFMIEGKETKRQILWVRQDNTNAIVRYEHYGFKQENLYDYILKI